MGNPVLKVGVSTAGAIITEARVPSVLVNGVPIVVIGANITPHSTGAHATAPEMTGGSSSVKAGGYAVCRNGDAASCGHTGAGGSTNVLAG